MMFNLLNHYRLGMAAYDGCYLSTLHSAIESFESGEERIIKLNAMCN